MLQLAQVTQRKRQGVSIKSRNEREGSEKRSASWQSRPERLWLRLLVAFVCVRTKSAALFLVLFKVESSRFRLFIHKVMGIITVWVKPHNISHTCGGSKEWQLHMVPIVLKTSFQVTIHKKRSRFFFFNLPRSLFSKSQHLDLCCHSWTAIFVTEEWSNVYIISYFLSFLSKLMVSCCTEQDEEKYRKFMIDCLLVSSGTRGRGNNLIILFGEFQWNSSMVLRSSFVTV